MNTMYTCTIRKVSTGYKLSAFQGDNLEHLHAICATLMQSPNYSRCYIVCVDWQGNVLFNMQPQAPQALAPGMGMAPQAAHYPQQLPQAAYAPQPAVPPPPPAWGQYYEQERAMAAQAQLPAYRRPAPPASHTQQVVIDAEFVDDSYAPALPAYSR